MGVCDNVERPTAFRHWGETWIALPYDHDEYANWEAAMRRAVPASDRDLDLGLSRWWISDDYLADVNVLCVEHFGHPLEGSEDSHV